VLGAQLYVFPERGLHRGEVLGHADHVLLQVLCLHSDQSKGPLGRGVDLKILLGAAEEDEVLVRGHRGDLGSESGLGCDLVRRGLVDREPDGHDGPSLLTGEQKPCVAHHPTAPVPLREGLQQLVVDGVERVWHYDTDILSDHLVRGIVEEPACRLRGVQNLSETERGC